MNDDTNHIDKIKIEYGQIELCILGTAPLVLPSARAMRAQTMLMPAKTLLTMPASYFQGAVKQTVREFRSLRLALPDDRAIARNRARG